MKGLIYLSRRPGFEVDLATGVRSLVAELRARETAWDLSIVTLERLLDDPLGPRTPYHTTLEITGKTADSERLADLLVEIGRGVADLADPSTSTLLIGESIAFIESECAPVRYQYLMRRRSDFDHAAYLQRYREVHYEFGLRTPGILGYEQFHVDLGISRSAAERAGLGVSEFDSVSELHLESLETFFAAVSKSSVPAEARLDEERFVDRERSLEFVSNVDWANASNREAAREG